MWSQSRKLRVPRLTCVRAANRIRVLSKTKNRHKFLKSCKNDFYFENFQFVVSLQQGLIPHICRTHPMPMHPTIGCCTTGLGGTPRRVNIRTLLTAVFIAPQVQYTNPRVQTDKVTNVYEWISRGHFRIRSAPRRALRVVLASPVLTSSGVQRTGKLELLSSFTVTQIFRALKTKQDVFCTILAPNNEQLQTLTT